MSPPSTGLAQSEQTRLVRHAKQIGMDPNLVLTRFAVERFLYLLRAKRPRDGQVASRQCSGIHPHTFYRLDAVRRCDDLNATVTKT